MNIQDLIIKNDQQVDLDQLVFTDENREKITQLLKEHQYKEHLQKYGLPLTHKLLLYGSSGCGKTSTAKGIATALGKPLILLNLSNVVNARIGETSQHVRMIFDRARRDKAVLFLDEFDQLGKARGEDLNDVGEMRRLVNSLIQLIDYLPEDVLLIAASNHLSIIDPALLRRFEMRMAYSLPDRKTLDGFYDRLLARFPKELHPQTRLYDVSFAEAEDNLYSVLKLTLIAKLEMASEIL